MLAAALPAEAQLAPDPSPPQGRAAPVPSSDRPAAHPPSRTKPDAGLRISLPGALCLSGVADDEGRCVSRAALAARLGPAPRRNYVLGITAVIFGVHTMASAALYLLFSDPLFLSADPNVERAYRAGSLAGAAITLVGVAVLGAQVAAFRRARREYEQRLLHLAANSRPAAW